MPSIKEALKIASVFISPFEAKILLEYTLGESIVLKDNLILLPKRDFQKFISLVKRRIKNEPIAYITGTQEFYGFSFIVSKDVLIPRADTEILIEKSIEAISQYFPQNPKIVDLCTGSGAIILTLAKLLKGGEFVGFDISSRALKIANLNKKRLDAMNVNFIKQDIFTKNFAIQADVLISNPPYIRQSDISILMPDVKNFEPHLALNGGGDGLDFYRQIAILGKNCKIILLEIGEGMKEDVLQIFSSNYDIMFCANDLKGKSRVMGFINNNL